MTVILNSVQQELQRRVITALNSVGVEASEAVVIRPASRPEYGDYQVDRLISIASRLKMKPMELVTKVVANLDLDDIAEKIEIAAPGFINISLSSKFITSYLSKDLPVALQDIPQADKSPCIVIDISSPNLAKEMHVGHLRSTVIGDAMGRILASLGNKVIRQNHVGDWGTQFGMLLQYMDSTGNTTNKIPDIEEFYKAARLCFDSDSEFANKSREKVVLLQSNDPQTLKKWQNYTSISLAHNQAIYERLNIDLTPADVRGESSYNTELPAIVDDFDKAGLLVESEGAKCVFLSTSSDPIILQKSDGGYLYATTDLATVRHRIQDLHANKILYFIDARQGQYLNQIFELSRTIGYAPADVCIEHKPFGMVMGKDGKPFKSRSGGTIKLASILNKAEQRALQIVQEKNPNLSETESVEVAHAVGIGAIKYSDLSRNRTSNYTFDWDNMLSFEGNTAPYIQYAYTRIISIFHKAGMSLGSPIEINNISLNDASERTLTLHLLRYVDALEKTAETSYPHYLCAYLYELATAFSNFYATCQVLNTTVATRNNRLYLCQLSAMVLKRGLFLLGIKTVQRM